MAKKVPMATKVLMATKVTMQWQQKLQWQRIAQNVILANLASYELWACFLCNLNIFMLVTYTKPLMWFPLMRFLAYVHVSLGIHNASFCIFTLSWC